MNNGFTRYQRWAAVLCAAAVAACGALPNGTPGDPNAAQLQQQVRLMLTFDENSDGVVTREELEAGLRRQFAAIDVAHHGYLDPKEAQAENDRRAGVLGASYSPLVDGRRNGMIDFDEFAAVPRSIFERLDRNHDGKLDQNELRLIQNVRGPVAPNPARNRGP